MRRANESGREHLHRVENVLLRLHSRRDVSEEQREVLLDAVHHVMWDDAIHVAAPWNQNVSLCGSWFRNLAPFDGERPDVHSGCWTCLQITDWFAREKAALTQVAEAARALLSVPRKVEKDDDGILRLDFTPQQEARNKLAEKVAALDGLA